MTLSQGPIAPRLACAGPVAAIFSGLWIGAAAQAAEAAASFPAHGRRARGDTGQRAPCSRAAASGACRASSSTSKAFRRRYPATPAARRRPRTTRRSSGGDTGHAESVRVTYDPTQDQLRPASADLLLGRARPDRTQSPGARRRHAIPLGDLLRRRRTEAASPRPTSPSWTRAMFRPADRHQGRARAGSTPPRPTIRTSRPRTRRSLHRDQRPAEGREPEAAVPRRVSGRAGSGPRGAFVNARRPGHGAGPPADGSEGFTIIETFYIYIIRIASLAAAP